MKAVADGLQRRAALLAEGSALRALLLQRAERYAAAPPPTLAPTPVPSDWPALLASLPEPAALPRLAETQRRDWAQLRLAQRLAQPLAEPPAPLGPLHAQVLVPRALELLRTLSPAYLQHLVEQIDALGALLPLAPIEAESPKRKRTRK